MPPFSWKLQSLFKMLRDAHPNKPVPIDPVGKCGASNQEDVDEDDEGGFIYLPPQRWTGTRWMYGLCWSTLITALLLAAFFSGRSTAIPSPTDLREAVLTADGKSFPSGQLTWSHKFTPLPCGKTPAEAKARGCHFDIIATAWLPPRCIDHELAAEFAAVHSWRYFRDPNGTEPLLDDPDTLGSQTGLIWTTHRWHWAHCLYMWKKLNRALVHGWVTDAETIKQGHTDHCVKTILLMAEPDAIRSIVEIIYPPC